MSLIRGLHVATHETGDKHRPYAPHGVEKELTVTYNCICIQALFCLSQGQLSIYVKGRPQWFSRGIDFNCCHPKQTQFN